MFNIDLSGKLIKSMRRAFSKSHLRGTSNECWTLLIVAGLVTWLFGGNFAVNLAAITAMWFVLNWTMDVADEDAAEVVGFETVNPPAPETVVGEDHSDEA